MKKNWVLVMCAALVLTVLAGCSDSMSKEETSFFAIVLENSESGILVEPEEGSAELNSADRITIRTSGAKVYDAREQEIAREDLQIGDQVQIFYDGQIAESYPAQVHKCYRIKLVSTAKRETDKREEAAVKSLVEDFGRRFLNVSLLGPEDVVKKSLLEKYGSFVSPALLEQWQRDPLHAPGRLTSSPWPDRIEILSIEKRPEGGYQVKGEIIELTSAKKDSEEVAVKRPLTLQVEKVEDEWLITGVDFGEDEVDGTSIVYENTDYGFRFSLPRSWEGYSIITEKWEGLAVAGAKQGEVVASGPLLSLRHPEWTEEEKRQDIPVLVFTLEQWDSLQEGQFHIGAAPIGPKEMARNAKYVFALPARYNYAFPTGYEEVEEILGGEPLQATAPAK